LLRLTIYGDFNCPFSALASARADVLAARHAYAIDWRAIQHDTTIPAAGEPVTGDLVAALALEVSTVRDLSEGDLRFQLAVPPVRSNTAAACAAFAASEDADGLRKRLFDAVWREGRNLGDPAELDRLGAVARDTGVAARWQRDFDALPQPITPTLVLPDGYVSRGLGALARLADFAAAESVTALETGDRDGD
jgi:2-hydroxychromene-2-carboxylate isomerase